MSKTEKVMRMFTGYVFNKKRQPSSVQTFFIRTASVFISSPLQAVMDPSISICLGWWSWPHYLQTGVYCPRRLSWRTNQGKRWPTTIIINIYYSIIVFGKARDHFVFKKWDLNLKFIYRIKAQLHIYMRAEIDLRPRALLKK